LLRLLFGSTGSTFLCLLPAVLAAPGTWVSFLQYHQLRGVQLESLAGGAIWLGRVLGLIEASIEYRYGAFQLVSPQADLALRWQPVLFGLVFGGVLVTCLLHFRKERQGMGGIAPESLVAYAVAALLAFIATSKVFSPQYGIWLLPFAPLLRPWHTCGLLALC